MKVNTGVLKTAGSDIEIYRNRVEAVNDELRTVIAEISTMKGIEVHGKLKRMSYDIEYSSYILSEMSEALGNIAEIYERNEEKVIGKRESSFMQYFAGQRIDDPSRFWVFGQDNPAQQNPSYSQLASMIDRFI